MSSLRRLASRAVLFGAASGMLSLAAAAQQGERATFYMISGTTDTIFAEQSTRTAARLNGVLVDRTSGIRQQFVAELMPDGEVSRTLLAVFRTAADTTPLVRVTIQLQGDSMVAEMSTGTTQRFASSREAMTYVNPSSALLEQALIRAKHASSMGAAVVVPLFQSAGGVTLPVTITWVGTDSATLAFGSGIVIRAAVSRNGRLLGGVIPAQRLRIVRVEGTRPLTMEKRDYSAPAGAPYAAEEVTLRTPAGISLAGTLTLPKVRPPTGSPAVVMITGSGPEERDESIPGVAGYRPFRQIADTLSRRGIAVLRLDDRGVGGSAAGPKDPTTADFADDIRAALAFLRTRPDIDGRKLGLVGHSEGGMIAPMIAATDSALDAIVLLAGPAKTGREILDYQLRYGVEHSEKIAADKRDSAIAAAHRQLDSTAAANAWVRYFLDYDPLATARRVKTPVLILQGENDRQVTADQAPVLAEAFRAAGDRDVTMHVFPRTNHLFLADADGSPSGYAALPTKQISPEILGAIADWLSAHLR